MVEEGIEVKRHPGAAQRRKAVRIAAAAVGVAWCVGTVLACVYATGVMAVLGGIALAAIGLKACSGLDVCRACRYEITVGRAICEKCEREALEKLAQRRPSEFDRGTGTGTAPGGVVN